MKNYISENISYLVTKMRCSQDEFGSLFDLNRSVISQYIKEKSQPKIETIQRICDYFEISIDDFINKSLEEVKKNTLNEPGSKYEINKQEESKIIQYLERVINDKDKIIESKDKIIETLEFQLSYFRSNGDKSVG